MTTLSLSGEAYCVRRGVHHRIDPISPQGYLSWWSHISCTVFGTVDVLELVEPPPILKRSIVNVWEITIDSWPLLRIKRTRIANCGESASGRN